MIQFLLKTFRSILNLLCAELPDSREICAETYTRTYTRIYTRTNTMTHNRTHTRTHTH